MGRRVEYVELTDAGRAHYEQKVARCLEALRRMLDEGLFEGRRKRFGLEMEFYVVDADAMPAMVNEELLARLESEDFQTELAQFNIEFNLAPHYLGGQVFSELEEELLTSYAYASRRARELGARVAMIGILPTLDNLHISMRHVSNNPRYYLLNEQILAARGEDIAINIEGTESLHHSDTSIMIESVTTSLQLHMQVTPGDFPRYYNASQAIAAAQVAVGCNSPFALGKQVWCESRIPVLEQAIDTRRPDRANKDEPPRVPFGNGWVSSAIDLWKDAVERFPPLLPLSDDEEPLEILDTGGVPHLNELTLLNGTIYRWNRPVYGIARGKPHLRIENRVLPAGPTMRDSIANAAFFVGLVRAVADLDQPISEQMDFAHARTNFELAARHGLDASLQWPGVGEVAATRLVLDVLLPLAADGLAALSVDQGDAGMLLGLIERRSATGVNGATWQIRTYQRLRNEGLDRESALAQMTRSYVEHMATNAPVHTWDAT